MLNISGHRGNANQNYLRFYLTSVRMATIKHANNKCWGGCGGKGTLIHCWMECKLSHYEKTVWRLLKRTKYVTAT
jgi:hypothetical protein